MTIRKPKEPVMTRLDADDAEWIEAQALVFGDRSTVLNRVVKIVRACIRTGILKWDLETLQELLQKNQEVQGNFAGSSPMKVDRAKRIRPIRLPGIHLFTSLRSHSSEAVGMAASRPPFRGAR